MSDRLKETRLSSAVANTLDTRVLIPTALPTLYRLTSIERLPTDQGCCPRAPRERSWSAFSVPVSPWTASSARCAFTSAAFTSQCQLHVAIIALPALTIRNKEHI
jgi:hypothetical protein